jgi:threonine dehydrogenase-like Zn-dependent dehydrogenase
MADAVYAVEPWIGCQRCADCIRGEPNLCGDGRLLGISDGGGLADTVDVPPRLLHRVPDGARGAPASLAEPWAVSVRSVHRARLHEIDERVLVLGGGSIGLLAGLASRDRVAEVGITCRYPHQSDLATTLGLTPIAPDAVDDWADEHRPGVVIETVGGEAETMSEAVRCVRPGGRIVVVGVFGTPRPTDYRAVVLKELEIVGSFVYGTVGSGSEFGAAVRRMASFTSELAALQTHQFALADVADAFVTADDKSSLAVKVTITP